MIRILLDQGIPRSAVYKLRESGWDVLHVGDIGMSRSTDIAILEYARTQERVLITLDADFHAILAATNAASPSVIRVRREGLKGDALAELILAVWPRMEAWILSGAMVTITDKSIRIRGLPLIPAAGILSDG